MSSAITDIEGLYKARKGVVRFVEVPELGFVAVAGTGSPDGPEFTGAVQALYAVSYGARFIVKKDTGRAPKVMPLEGLWWMDDPDQQDLVRAVADGQGTMADTDRDRWCWKAMIMQPAPVDQGTVSRAVEQARKKKDLEALDRLRFERWEEGRSAQLLHVGPYAEEASSIMRLHEGIAAAGYRPRGRHHEIYLGDPRRSSPERLRTVLRHPVEPL